RTKHEDRLSMLTDDILLSILGRVDTATATRTSVLSKRWRDLPWLLPVLNLRVWNFLPHPCPEPIAAHHMDQAMSRLTKATRSFLADPNSKSTIIKRLSLQLYVTGDYTREIGPLARDAIDCGVVKKLCLAIVDEKDPRDCEHEYMLQQALAVDGFFTAYPSVFQCLTKLRLYNVRFAEWDMQHLLFDSCKQLNQLSLSHCDVGDSSVWQINAPDSKLRILEVRMSCLKRIEVLCLPKLKHLCWDEWFCFEAPLRFGSVPSLKGLGLICGATIDHQEFSLSQVLHGTRNIHALTLDFEGERLWIQPEGKQLCHAFKQLRKLSICGIFVDFDLLWTINLLEAAPSIEIFSVRIWDHACQDDEQLRTRTGYEAQRTKPSWSMPKFTSSETWQLRELEIVGFRPQELQISFLRSVMERASNLKMVLLKEDKEPCDACDSMNTPRGGFCPADKGEQEAIVKQLTDGVGSSARIIFPKSGGS
ncbi:F-box/LRR-repeat protein At2g29930-like, partial [Triticum urartu]